MQIKKKIIFLTYIPSPYRVDFFNELSKFTDLNVVYYNESMPNSGWKQDQIIHNYNYTILFNKTKLLAIFDLFKILKANNNEIFVVGGYAKLVEIISILYFKIFNIDFVLNTDGGFVTKGFFKTKLKKFLINSASYYLSSGINATKTLLYYGANLSKVFEYHFTSINKLDVIDSESISDLSKSNLKQKLNLNTHKSYVVYVGRLIRLKGVDVLIDAISKINTKDVELLLIGDGVETLDLQCFAEERNALDKVHFLGKKNKLDVFNFLKASDVFVLPSRGVGDVWGLVVNEAIANGLAVIATDRVGAAYSLIDDAKNGYIIESNNAEVLATTIDLIYKQDIVSMQNHSINIAQKYTIEQMVKDHLVLFEKLDTDYKIKN